MKKMGRSLLAVCAVLLMIVMMTACGGGQEETKELNVEGTWKMVLDDENLSQEKLTVYSTYFEGMSTQNVTLKFSEGTKLEISATVDNTPQTEEGTYAITGENTVSITDPSGYVTGTAGTYTLVVKDNKMRLKDQGAEYFRFDKQ